MPFTQLLRLESHDSSSSLISDSSFFERKLWILAINSLHLTSLSSQKRICVCSHPPPSRCFCLRLIVYLCWQSSTPSLTSIIFFFSLSSMLALSSQQRALFKSTPTENNSKNLLFTVCCFFSKYYSLVSFSVQLNFRKTLPQYATSMSIVQMHSSGSTEE